mgnify:CR=1 FL=1|jgi:hypothetical protein
MVDWLESHMLPCFFKKYLGLDCPGCGMQRALVALLKGDIAGSFHHYPALLPMLAMLVLLVLHLVFKFERGGTWLKYTYLFVVATVVVSYMAKLTGW